MAFGLAQDDICEGLISDRKRAIHEDGSFV